MNNDVTLYMYTTNPIKIDPNDHKNPIIITSLNYATCSRFKLKTYHELK